MTTKRLRRISFLVALLAFGNLPAAWAKYEQEQAAMEAQLQERIERLLAKTLPANSYLVAVKVILAAVVTPAAKSAAPAGRPRTLTSGAGRFVLPGVPEKKQFMEPDRADVVESGPWVETSVKQLSVTVLLAPDVPGDQVKSLRDLLATSLPFDPLRGDEMDIRPSPLLKPITAPMVKTNSPAAAPAVPWWLTLLSGSHLPWVLLSVILLGGLLVLALFLFWPIRQFLSRLLTVLPRMGEHTAPNMLPGNTPSPFGPLGGMMAAGTSPLSLTGNERNNAAIGFGQEADANAPFRFIRQEELNKLPIFFRQLTAPQAAVVLAYLPPLWASQVLTGLDARSQSAIMRELSQPQEIPAQTVKDIEKQLKDKLPYLVGGMEWVQSVYQSTQPHVQRELLGSLAQQTPDLAQILRRKTFFFEDLAVLGSGQIRLILQEVGYPTMASALKDEKPEFRDAFFKKLPTGIREIIRQEFDMAPDDLVAINDAKNRVMTLARRLIQEGRIVLGRGAK